MAERMIISIGRECGSGGHEIGEKIAAHYGIKLYDENIIDLISQKTGQDVNFLRSMEEKRKTGILGSNATFATDSMAVFKHVTREDQLFVLERNTILDLAAAESFVIIGRAANAILADHENAMRFYIYAPESFKIPRVRKDYKLATENEARKVMLTKDKERRAYFNYYSGKVWGSTDVHDFMLDSSIFGIDATVEIMEGLIDRKFG